MDRNLFAGGRPLTRVTSDKAGTSIMEELMSNSKSITTSNGIISAKFRERLTSALLSAALIAGSQGCSGQHTSAQQSVQKAVELQEAGQYQDAIAALTNCLNADPDSAEAYYQRGLCYVALSDLPQAISDLEKACDRQPTSDYICRALGTAYAGAKRNEEALQYLTNAVELNKESAAAFFDRGCLLQDLGQQEYALEDFRRAAELNPRDSDTLLRCAVLESQQNPDTAMERFAEALQADRHNPEAWLQRGLFHEKTGSPQRALGDFTVACRLASGDPMAWSHCGRVLTALNRRDEAIRCLSRAAELDVENQHIQQQLQIARQSAKQTSAVADNSTKTSLNVSSVSLPEILTDNSEPAEAVAFLAFPFSQDNQPNSANTAPAAAPSSTSAERFEAFPLDDASPSSARNVAAPEAKTADIGFPLFPIENADEPVIAATPAAETVIASSTPEPDSANPFPGNAPQQSPVQAVEQSESQLPAPVDAAPTAMLSLTAADNANPFAVALKESSGETLLPVDVSPQPPVAVEGVTTSDDDEGVAGVVSAENMLQKNATTSDQAVDTGALYLRALQAYRQGDRTASIAAFELLLDADPDHLEGRFRYANVLADTGDPEEALIVCTPLGRNAPKNSDYACFRAQLLTKLKSYDEAAIEYTRMLSLGSRQNEGLTERAKVYLAAGRWEDATKDLTELLRQSPKDVLLLQQRARAQERMQSWPLAIADWTEIGLIESDNVEAMEARADAFLQVGENSAAISDLASILSFQPENTRIATRLARMHASLEQWAQVASVLTPVIARQEADNSLTFLRAKALVELGDETVALGDLNQVLSTEPDHTEALAMRAQLLAAAGDMREALEDLDHATEVSPDNMELVRLRARIHADSGDRNAAIADLTRLISQNPNDTTALLTRAEMFKLIGEDDGAMADADAILRREPSHARALILRGDGHFAKQQFDVAMAAYNTVLEDDNSDAELLWRRCQCRLNAGLELLAAQDLERIIELNPTHHGALMSRARMQESSGVFEGAAKDLSRVLENRPDVGEAWASRGSIYHRTGRFEEAIRDLSRAILLQPDASEPIYRRGLAYHQLGDSDKALDDLTVALKLSPANPDYIFSRGNIYAAQGKTTQAIADYEKAVKDKPSHAAAWYNLGNLVFAQEEFENAIDCWDKAIAIQPGLFRAYNNRAAACVQLRRYKQAIDDYETTIELNPGFAQAHDNYAFLMATAEDPQYHNPTTAVLHAQKACELTNNQDWTYLSTLAAAYAEAGDYVSARKWLVESHKVAPEAERMQLVQLSKIYESEMENNRETKENPAKPKIGL